MTYYRGLLAPEPGRMEDLITQWTRYIALENLQNYAQKFSLYPGTMSEFYPNGYSIPTILPEYRAVAGQWLHSLGRKW